MGDKGLKPAFLKGLRRLLAAAYYLSFLVCVVEAGAAVGTFDNAPPVTTFPFGAAFVFIAWTFIIFIHEVGHAVVAWLLGWRVVVFSVRGLTFSPGSLRFHYGAHAFPMLNGGVLVVPRKKGEHQVELACILASGSAANFVLAICTGLLAWRNQGSLATLLAVTTFLSALTGTLNLVPWIWGIENDGSMIIEVVRDGVTEIQIQELKIGVEIAESRRPRDWNPELVQKLKDHVLMDQGRGLSGIFLFSRYFDERNLDAARSALEWSEKKLGASNVSVRLCRALLLAYAEHDGAASAEILSTMKSRRVTDMPAYRIAQAVAAWASGDVAGQETAVRLARVALDRVPFADPSDFELLEEIENTIPANKPSVEVMAN